MLTQRKPYSLSNLSGYSLIFWWGPGMKEELFFLSREEEMSVFEHLLCVGNFTYQSVSSVAQSCPTLCDPMNHNMPGLPVHHQLPEFTQTRVHWVGDAIPPSHPLLTPSSPAFNLSQHQGLFKWVSSSHEVAKVMEFRYNGLSRVFSNTTVQKHQFFSAQLCL